MRKTALVMQYLEQLWRVIPLPTRHLRREGLDMQDPLRRDCLDVMKLMPGDCVDLNCHLPALCGRKSWEPLFIAVLTNHVRYKCWIFNDRGIVYLRLLRVNRGVQL